MNIHPWAGISEAPGNSPGTSSLNLVQRVEMLVLAELDKPLHISELCRVMAVSERALRKAFNKTCGLPPCRRLRMLRLSEVRRALLSSHDQDVTVTAIATGFGFAELGRFSVEFRKVFGESASTTLQRARSEPGKRCCRRPA